MHFCTLVELSVHINDSTIAVVTVCVFKRMQCLKGSCPVMKHGTDERHCFTIEQRHGKVTLGIYMLMDNEGPDEMDYKILGYSRIYWPTFKKQAGQKKMDYHMDIFAANYMHGS